MNILVTGNLGYIGTELTKKLIKNKKFQVYGFDNNYFKSCLFGKRGKENKIIQIKGDVRKFPTEILKNIDVLVHLAAISNDPIGNKFKKVTKDINLISSKRILDAAINAKVKKFIFASSCSIYGKNKKNVCDEKSKIKPLTAYAKSKTEFEKYLNKKSNKIAVTSLRFATACGYSDRLRLDLVLNDFVTSAFLTKKIIILSDGKAFRPLIDVEDMCRAIEWAIFINKRKKTFVNVGSNRNNFNIKDLALKVKKITNSQIILNKKNKSDNRSYKVNFNLFRKLAKNYYPKKNINKSIKEILSGLKSKKFKDKKFRDSSFMRLKHLEKLIKKKKINTNLDWK